MLKTAVLMPRSTLYPALALDMLNGLKLSLQEQGVKEDVKLIVDNIGFGINEPEIYSKAEKMILQEDADVVIVFADTIIAALLQPLFTATNKILLILNFGANLPRSWKPEPTSISLSLNFCLHAKLTGELAARKENKNAANVLSYYDGGYNQCYCMINSHQVQGGIARFNHVTHLKLEEFTLEPLGNFLAENAGVETLLCLFSGEQAERFYTDIHTWLPQHTPDLFVSPMMLDEALFSHTGFKVPQVQGHVPWHSGLESDANTLFKRTMQEGLQKSAHYFSLLGWEAGLLLAAICQKQAGGSQAAAVVNAVTSMKFNSPRGILQIDAATHHCYAPSWYVQANAGGIQFSEAVPGMEAVWQAFTAEPLLPEASMWRNTYLCI